MQSNEQVKTHDDEQAEARDDEQTKVCEGEQTEARDDELVGENDFQPAGTDAEQAETNTDDSAEDLDEQHLVLKRLLLAHEAWFNVQRDYEYAGRKFPGYAEFQSFGTGYVLTKRAKLWGANAFEYMFFHLSDCLGSAELDDLVDFVTTKGLEKVTPGPEHMTSYLSLVIIANSAEDGIDQIVRKTKFRKNFKFQLEGWADLRLAVVDLAARKVYTNSVGKEIRASLANNAGFESKSRKKLRR